MFSKLLKEHNKRLAVAMRFYKQAEGKDVNAFFREAVRKNTVNFLKEMRYNEKELLSQSADNTLCKPKKQKRQNTTQAKKKTKS